MASAETSTSSSAYLESLLSAGDSAREDEARRRLQTALAGDESTGLPNWDHLRARRVSCFCSTRPGFVTCSAALTASPRLLHTLRTTPVPELAPQAHQATLFGILGALAEQLRHSRWSSLLQQVGQSDPLAALAVWRTQRRYARLLADAAYLGQPQPASLYAAPQRLRPPGAPSLCELRCASLHAFAAYGALADALGRHTAGLADFLAGGLASTQAALVSDAEAEAAAYARAAGVPLSSLRRGVRCVPCAFNPVAYVVWEARQPWVVVAIRGTLSGHDTLTDAAATPTPFPGGLAHAGMASAAWNVVRSHLPAAACLLAQRASLQPRLLFTGHSLGGGVAALAAQLCGAGDADVDAAARRGAEEGAAGDAGAALWARSAVRDALAIAFACPACASLPLSLALRERCTSLVAAKDIVPRLSMSSVHRLAARLASGKPASRDNLRRRSSDASDGGAAEEPQAQAADADDALLADAAAALLAQDCPAGAETSDDAQLWAAGGVEMLDLGGRSRVLLPAGRCLHLRHLTSQAGPSCEERHPLAFSDVRLGARMLSDHRPSVYAKALAQLEAPAPAAVRTTQAAEQPWSVWAWAADAAGLPSEPGRRTLPAVDRGAEAVLLSLSV